MDFLTAFFWGLLWLPGIAAAVAPVGMFNKGFIAGSNIAISSKTTFCLRYVTGK